MTLQDANEVLVFAYDYRPMVPFEVISRLQQDAVDEILGREIDGSEIVSDSSDYRGYIVLYSANDDPGEYALVFVEDESLSTGDEYELATDAVFFSTDANLLEVTIDGDGDGDDDDDETPTPEEDETPTPEDETPTPEEGTPTPEDGGTPTPEPGGGGNGGGDGGDGGAGA